MLLVFHLLSFSELDNSNNFIFEKLSKFDFAELFEYKGINYF